MLFSVVVGAALLAVCRWGHVSALWGLRGLCAVCPRSKELCLRAAGAVSALSWCGVV